MAYDIVTTLTAVRPVAAPPRIGLAPSLILSCQRNAEQKQQEFKAAFEGMTEGEKERFVLLLEAFISS